MQFQERIGQVEQHMTSMTTLLVQLTPHQVQVQLTYTTLISMLLQMSTMFTNVLEQEEFDNGSTVASTVKPTGTSATDLVSTSDTGAGTGRGYLWKYMYTVSFADTIKFVTTDFMPVKTIEAKQNLEEYQMIVLHNGKLRTMQ